MQFTEILQAINRITAPYKIIRFEKDPCATNIPFTTTATITPAYIWVVWVPGILAERIHRDPKRDPTSF